jgi:ferredoxin-NADP reductase
MDYESQRGNVARIIDRLHPSRLQLKVSEIRQETATTKTIRLVSPGRRLPPFQAGQYINLFVKIGNTKTSRPYSLSSAPNQTGFYDITVRRVESGFVSNYLLDQLQIGDTLESTAPAGHFHYNPLFHGNDLVFLAGGSGITPFMSMIREVTDRGLARKIHLIYGSRNREDIIFRDEIEDRAAHHSRFHVTHIISEPPPDYTGCCGFISADLLKDVLGDVSARTFYLCGPDVMYRFCRDELSRLGIPDRKVRNEMFGPPVDIAKSPDWPSLVNTRSVFRVSVQNGKTIPTFAGESLMTALEKAGLAVPASCRSGECSLCRTKLLSGKVFHPQSAKIRKSDKQFGYIHPCVAYPLENLEIMI